VPAAKTVTAFLTIRAGGWGGVLTPAVALGAGIGTVIGLPWAAAWPGPHGAPSAPMMSPPIINPPQSAILGMHATKERAVVENGQVVVRPMMYLALSYDHRIIDGREAVLTLVAIKDALEDPARLLLDL